MKVDRNKFDMQKLVLVWDEKKFWQQAFLTVHYEV